MVWRRPLDSTSLGTELVDKELEARDAEEHDLPRNDPSISHSDPRDRDETDDTKEFVSVADVFACLERGTGTLLAEVTFETLLVGFTICCSTSSSLKSGPDKSQTRGFFERVSDAVKLVLFGFRLAFPFITLDDDDLLIDRALERALRGHFFILLRSFVSNRKLSS